MGIQINGITDTISATDGGLAVSGQQLTGVTDINASGIITATSFSGDGSGLTGVGGGSSITAGNTSATVTDTGSDGRFVVTTEGSESLRVTAAGLVGIGTSSPGAIIHTYANVGGGNPSTSGTTDANVIARFQGGSINLDAGVTAPGHIWLQPRLTSNFATNTNLLLCPNGGSVGIGTAPSELLHIKGASPYMLFEGTETNGQTLYIRESAGSLTFGRYAIGERARIDSSGRLLVGTSTARATGTGGSINFVLEAAGTYTQAVFATNQNNSNGAYATFAKSRGSSANSFAAVQSSDEIGIITFEGADGTNSIPAARIAAYVDGTPGTNDMPGRLMFFTTADGASFPTERMRIGNDGASALYSQNTSSTLLNLQTAASAGTSAAIITGTYGATGVLTGTVSIRVWSNGNIQNTNNSYTAISDIKLKENIVDANSQWDDLKAFRVRNYNLKEGQTHTQIGLVAQEVEPISPGLVYESPDRDEEGNDLGTVTKSVNYSVLYMKAVKALQEAMERIEQLESKVAALESA